MIFQRRPDDGIAAIANVLGSDTDTIATMAGALVGAVAPIPPAGPIQDHDYVISEAVRLFGVGRRHDVETFRYPDLLHWQPPTAANDAVGVFDGRPSIAGLGAGTETGDPYYKERPEAMWRWISMSYGQTVLAKTKKELPTLPASAMPRSGSARSTMTREERLPLFVESNEHSRRIHRPGSEVTNVERDRPRAAERADMATGSLHEVTRIIIDRGFPPDLLGKTLLRFADSEDGIERAVAFASIIAKARISRLGTRRERPEHEDPAEPPENKLEINLRGLKPLSIGGKPAELILWLTCVNHAATTTTIDRLEIETWFGQPTATALLNMPVQIKRHSTVNDLAAKAVLNSDQVERIRAFGSDPNGRVYMYISASCKSDGREYVYRTTVERAYEDVAPGIRLTPISV